MAGNEDSQKPHLRDVLPQDLGLHGLRVPEVHGFIEELVDDDEVIPDRLLLQLPEVVLEHVHLCTALRMTYTLVLLDIEVYNIR